MATTIEMVEVDPKIAAMDSERLLRRVNGIATIVGEMAQTIGQPLSGWVVRSITIYDEEQGGGFEVECYRAVCPEVTYHLQHSKEPQGTTFSRIT